jgi:nitrite reductase/ring-hydroxylating ferredoxin subunit
MPTPLPQPTDRTDPAGPDRRTLLAGVAAGGVALPLLAACGSGSTTGSVPGGGGKRPSGPLTSTADIPVGGGRIFGSENVVVTQPTSGDFKAFSATCTHQGCQVSRISDGMIQCLCHGSEFSIADGSVQGGPASRPLPEEQITVARGKITLA